MTKSTTSRVPMSKPDPSSSLISSVVQGASDRARRSANASFVLPGRSDALARVYHITVNHTSLTCCASFAYSQRTSASVAVRLGCDSYGFALKMSFAGAGLVIVLVEAWNVCQLSRKIDSLP